MPACLLWVPSCADRKHHMMQLVKCGRPQVQSRSPSTANTSTQGCYPGTTMTPQSSDKALEQLSSIQIAIGIERCSKHTTKQLHGKGRFEISWPLKLDLSSRLRDEVIQRSDYHVLCSCLSWFIVWPLKSHFYHPVLMSVARYNELYPSLATGCEHYHPCHVVMCLATEERHRLDNN